MPVFFEQDIDPHTRLAIWKIEEEEGFFDVPLQQAITHPHKRLQHLAGRYLLRYLFPDFPLHLVKIADSRKPFLEDEAYHFSVSHSGDYAAALVSRHKRVGVDVEAVSAKAQRLAAKFLHSEELAQVPAAADVTRLFTLLWSCKESVFKWWSFGKVDFSEDIRLQLEPLPGRAGCLQGMFQREEKHFLSIHYRLFEDVCLTWTLTAVGGQKR